MTAATEKTLSLVLFRSPQINQAGAFLLACEALSLEYQRPFRVPDLYLVIAKNRLSSVLPTEMNQLIGYDGKKQIDPSTVFLILDYLSRKDLLHQDGGSFRLSKKGKQGAVELRRIMGYKLKDLRQAAQLTA